MTTDRWQAFLETPHMRNHWLAQPWAPGAHFFTVHVTFPGDDAFRSHVAQLQSGLAGVPGLDPVPLEWLHLTMQGIGPAEEVRDDVDQITEAVRRRLVSIPRLAVEFGPVDGDPEGVGFEPVDRTGLDRIREAVRAGIADVWGPDRVPESETWRPHVTISYSAGDGPTSPIAHALAPLRRLATIVTHVRSVEMIDLNRDAGEYRWDVVASLPLS